MWGSGPPWRTQGLIKSEHNDELHILVCLIDQNFI